MRHVSSFQSDTVSVHREQALFEKFDFLKEIFYSIINKTISKCRDSFRVSKNDKELLLKYKRKICQK